MKLRRLMLTCGVPFFSAPPSAAARTTGRTASQVAPHAVVVLHPALGRQAVVVPPHRVETPCRACAGSGEQVGVGVAGDVADVQAARHGRAAGCRSTRRRPGRRCGRSGRRRRAASPRPSAPRSRRGSAPRAPVGSARSPPQSREVGLPLPAVRWPSVGSLGVTAPRLPSSARELARRRLGLRRRGPARRLAARDRHRRRPRAHGHPHPLAVSAHFVAAPGSARRSSRSSRCARAGRSARCGRAWRRTAGRRSRCWSPPDAAAGRHRAVAARRRSSVPARAGGVPPQRHARGEPRNGILEQLEVRLDPATAGWTRGRPAERRGGGVGAPRRRPRRRPAAAAHRRRRPAAVPFDLGIPGWVPTVELTVLLRCPPGTAGCGWCSGRGRCTAAGSTRSPRCGTAPASRRPGAPARRVQAAVTRPGVRYDRRDLVGRRQAARRLPAAQRRRPRSTRRTRTRSRVSARYVSSPDHGTARRGRAPAHRSARRVLAARISQDDAVRAEVLVSAGALSTADPYWTSAPSRPLPPVEDCPRTPAEARPA